jgi:hypothetical protein
MEKRIFLKRLTERLRRSREQLSRRRALSGSDVKAVDSGDEVAIVELDATRDDQSEFLAARYAESAAVGTMPFPCLTFGEKVDNHGISD